MLSTRRAVSFFALSIDSPVSFNHNPTSAAPAEMKTKITSKSSFFRIGNEESAFGCGMVLPSPDGLLNETILGAIERPGI
jgi:hypothetical protein